jgi:hypothetical protein
MLPQIDIEGTKLLAANVIIGAGGFGSRYLFAAPVSAVLLFMIMTCGLINLQGRSPYTPDIGADSN